jgi:hypothetical protein
MIFRRKIMLFYAQRDTAWRRTFFLDCSIAPLQGATQPSKRPPEMPLRGPDSFPKRVRTGRVYA